MEPLNMFPRPTENNVANRCLGESETFLQFASRHSCYMECTDFDNTFSGQLVRTPALTDCICHIIERSTEKQVDRINAGRVIAVMADEQALRDWAIMQLPRIPRSQHWPFVGGIEIPRRIAGILGSGPCPTWPQFRAVEWRRPTLVNLVPKAFLDWSAPKVILNISQGFPFDVTEFGYGILPNPRLLSAAAVAVAVGDFVRRVVCGIMGLHGRAPFDYAALRGVCRTAGASCCSDYSRLAGGSQ